MNAGAVVAESLAQRIISTLREQGFQALLVGGCVRDLLLGLKPKDFDVATDATPDQVMALFPKSDAVGAHFGVVIVHEGGAHVEVATFRSEGEYQDGRRPMAVEHHGDPRHDALRRDFTINALFLDPATGEVVDFAGGQQDLREGVIRTVGEAARRFAEDHLRMLRAVRFAARFGFRIEEATMRAMQEHAGSIAKISAERVRDELVRILTEGGARRGFELLAESGLLAVILPEVAAMKGVEQPAEFHPEGDVWEHTLRLLEGLKNPTAALAMGALLHDVGKPRTFERAPDRIRFSGHVAEGEKIARGICERLRFSKDDTAQIVALVHHHMQFGDVQRMKESTLKRFLRLENFDEHLALHRLDCLASHGSLACYDYAKAKREATPAEVLRPARLLTGADLIEMGYAAGPKFREVLDAVEEAQLEGKIHTAEQAREWAKAEMER